MACSFFYAFSKVHIKMYNIDKIKYIYLCTMPIYKVHKKVYYIVTRLIQRTPIRSKTLELQFHIPVTVYDEENRNSREWLKR